MARIPTAQNVQQVRPGQLPQVRVSQAAAGVDVYRAQGERGQTIGRVGQMLEQQAIKFREEEDLANARAATTEYAEVVQRLNYGDPNDPNSGQGYYSLSGNAALQARASYEESLEKEYQRIADSLQSKGARRRFEQVGTTRKMSALDSGARFAAQQLKVYSQATAAGERKALTMEAISNPHNNQNQLTAIAMSVRAQMHKELGHPDNVSPEKRKALHTTIEAAVTAAQTEAHLGAIDTLLSSQSATAAADAEEYFKKHKSEIAPDKRDDIEKLLKDHSLIEKSQTAADAVMAMNLGPSGRLAYARANFKGEERDAIVNRIKVRNAEIRTAQEAGKRDASAKLWNLVADGESLDQIRKQLTSTEWAHVAKQIPNAQNVILSIARGEVDLIRSVGYEDRFYKLSTEDKAAISIKSLDGQTTAAEKSRLIPQILGAQAELTKKAAKTEEAIRKQAPYNDAVKHLRENAPAEWATAWDKNEKNQAKRDMGDIFVAHMNAWVKEYLATHDGAPPTVPEMTAKAREIFTPGSLALQSAAVIKSDPKGFGEGERSIEVAAHVAPERMSQKQLDAAYQDYDDIPAQKRAEIENQLAKLKVPKRTKLVEQIAAAQQLGQTERMHGLMDAALRGVDYEEYRRLHSLPPAEQRTATLSTSDMKPGLKKLIRESLEEAGIDLTRPIIEQLGAAYVLRDRARIQRLLSLQSETQ